MRVQAVLKSGMSGHVIVEQGPPTTVQHVNIEFRSWCCLRTVDLGGLARIAAGLGNNADYCRNARSARHMGSNRHDFTEHTRKVIAERGGYRCADPDCLAVTVGPALLEKTSAARVGVAAHIHAASPDGPRYEPTQTEAERRSVENGLWMCQTHGRLIDSDESGHTGEELLRWKVAAERKAAAELGLPTARSLFRLQSGDQTTYINLPRFIEIAAHTGFQLADLPALNKPLLETGGPLCTHVLELEQILERLKLDAMSVTNFKGERHCEAVVGSLVMFKGRFRSKNAPRMKGGRIPDYHATGNLDLDHLIRKNFGSFELNLLLDSFWYASRSAVGLFRSNGYVAIKGIARVHRTEDAKLIASPLWMALPGEALFD
jgi:hypothetical protein